MEIFPNNKFYRSATNDNQDGSGTVISLGLSLCVEERGSGGQHNIMGTPLRGTAWYGDNCGAAW